MNAYVTTYAYTPLNSNSCSHFGGVKESLNTEDNSQSCLPTPDECNNPKKWLSGNEE